MAALRAGGARGPLAEARSHRAPRLALSSRRPSVAGVGVGMGPSESEVGGGTAIPTTSTHTLLRPLGGDAHALGVCGDHPLTTTV